MAATWIKSRRSSSICSGAVCESLTSSLPSAYMVPVYTQLRRRALRRSDARQRLHSMPPRPACVFFQACQVLIRVISDQNLGHDCPVCIRTTQIFLFWNDGRRQGSYRNLDAGLCLGHKAFFSKIYVLLNLWAIINLSITDGITFTDKKERLYRIDKKYFYLIL